MAAHKASLSNSRLHLCMPSRRTNRFPCKLASVRAPSSSRCLRLSVASAAAAGAGKQALLSFVGAGSSGSLKFQYKPASYPVPEQVAAAPDAAAPTTGRLGNLTFKGAGKVGAVSFHPGTPDSRIAATQPLLARLKAYGLAGVVAYGLFNTMYYTGAFVFIWLYVARVPSGQGLAAAARRAAEVAALTWAGSQVTKVPRAFGALMLAPLVDIGLKRLQGLLRLRTRRAAFLVVLAACIGLAGVVFGTVVAAWA